MFHEKYAYTTACCMQPLHDMMVVGWYDEPYFNKVLLNHESVYILSSMSCVNSIMNASGNWPAVKANYKPKTATNQTIKFTGLKHFGWLILYYSA